MVWIPGGGFFTGAGNSYEASKFATRGDVVVVTVNYRLGIFGFFGYPGLPGSGTYGIQDQQAALRWVQRNARAFGGDPHNVTVAGESAGGMSVCAQLTSPTSTGLFAKAIMQSGSARRGDQAAVAVLREAGGAAATRAPASAARLYAAAVRLLAPGAVERAPLLAAQASAHMAAGQWVPAYEAVREALALAPTVRVITAAAALENMLGRHREATLGWRRRSRSSPWR